MRNVKTINKGCRTFHFEGIGPIRIEKSRRAKKMILSMDPKHGLRAAVPYWVSYTAACDILANNTGWVRQYLAKVRVIKDRHDTMLSGRVEGDERKDDLKLSERLNYFASKYGFQYNKVSIRRLKSKWGSCSYGNNISLNSKLAFLPEKLSDYVILHELLHTRLRNHSKEFWEGLTAILENAKVLDSELKQYHPVFF